MMTNITDAEEKSKLDELSECISKCRQCGCVAMLKKFLRRSNGTINQYDIKQAVCENLKSIVYINENFIYLTLQTDDMVQIQRIKSMWTAMLQRSTEARLQGRANDFALVIDVVHQELENSLVYTLSFIQPVFVLAEDNSITLAFTVDNMCFGKETITLEEIEYDKMLENERLKGMEDYDPTEFSETEEFIGTDEYI